MRSTIRLGVAAGVWIASAATPADAGPTAQPPQGATSKEESTENARAVTRYEDEATLGYHESTLVQSVIAHTASQGGRQVTLLAGGTSVTQVAEHDGSILVMFADPRNPANLEMGWISASALELGSPSHPCRRPEVRFSNALGAFCAVPCRNSGECAADETCAPAGLPAMRNGKMTNLLTYCIAR